MTLGRLARAIPPMFRVGFASAVAYRSEFLIWVLTTNMPLVMLALWTAVAKEAPVGRFGSNGFGAYFIATLIVRLMTSTWVVWELNWDIRQGSLAPKLLRPIHPLVTYAIDNLAAVPLRAMLSLPIALVALVVLGTGHLSHSLVQWAIVPLSLLGAWTANFCAMAAIGTLGLYWESSVGLFDLWLALYFVFSGYILPLELLPHWLYEPVRWLPFRFLLSFPVETMLGLISPTESLIGLAVQWLYALLFLLGALKLWSAGIRRYSAFGG